MSSSDLIAILVCDKVIQGCISQNMSAWGSDTWPYLMSASPNLVFSTEWCSSGGLHNFLQFFSYRKILPVWQYVGHLGVSCMMCVCGTMESSLGQSCWVEALAPLLILASCLCTPCEARGVTAAMQPTHTGFWKLQAYDAWVTWWKTSSLPIK